MAQTLKGWVDKILEFSFLVLAIATPLIFTTQTTEIFEVPKMFFVYFFASIILFLYLSKSILEAKIRIPASWVSSSFVVFLIIQFISAAFSRDIFLSIFGYPTRLNGGLLSQLAYFIIFISAIVWLDTKKAQKLLLAIVIAATAVSFWGIPAHFDKDPTCLVLTGNLTSACWQKDFDPTLRIFSTLGQPNWLASYLVLTIPISIAFFLHFTSRLPKLFFMATSTIMFLALILTTSRAGILGIGIATVTLLVLLGVKSLKHNSKNIALMLGLFAVILAIFGSFLTERVFEALTASKPNTVFQTNSESRQSQTTVQSPPTYGGTESGKIRFIVWQGAFEIFKKWPLLGSGPETFASTYYLFRPAAHNNTTEWEFFYNKAHNEFLNYLSNTGLVGFLALIFFNGAIIAALVKNKKGETNIMAKAVSAANIGYFTTIFFGFSTVATQTTFFIATSCALVLNGQIKAKEIPLPLEKNLKIAALTISAFLGLFVLTQNLRLVFSDIFEKKARAYSSTYPNRSLLSYDNALSTFPANNPYLTANFAYAIATYIPQLSDSDSQRSLTHRADYLAQESVRTSPNSFLVMHDITKTYLLLSSQDPKYQDNVLIYANKLPSLAPTYPASYLTLAKVQAALDKKDEAKVNIEKALELKPDLKEAQELLQELTINN